MLSHCARTSSASVLLPCVVATTMTFKSPTARLGPPRGAHMYCVLVCITFLVILHGRLGVESKELQNKLAAAHQSEEDVSTQKKILYRNANSDCGCWLIVNRETVNCRGKGCTQVPRNLTISNAGKLRITGTEIDNLKPGDFRGYEHLTDLQLDNNEISHIRPGTFQNLTLLLNLNLAFNHLSILEQNVFVGLVSLKWLRLSKNGFTRLSQMVPALIPNILPNLKQLTLAENALGKIEQDDFYLLSFSKLEHLDLSNCALTNIHPKALSPLRSLTRLVLKENTLQNGTLTELMSVLKHSSLQILDISRSGFTGNLPRRLMQLIANSNVTELNLAHNTLTQLNNRTFPLMPKLKTLSLNHCGIYVIGNHSFEAFPNLRVLNMSKNSLVGIPEAMLSALPQLEVLNLSGNSRAREEEAEEEGGSTTGGEFELLDQNFKFSTRLKNLDLSDTNVGIVSANALQGLTNLTDLNLHNCSLYRIEPFAFSSLTALQELRLEGNFFEYQNFSRSTFTGLRQLRKLYLDNCGIAGFSEDGVFAEMSHLFLVSLRHNHLTTLAANPFWQVTSLQLVDLTKNFLRAWEERVFEHSAHLNELILTGNKISTVTVAMALDFANLSRVDLSDNPMDCDCRLSILKDMTWPLTNDSSNPELHVEWNNASLTGLRSIRTEYCYSPDEWRLKRMVDFLASLDSTGPDCQELSENVLPTPFYFYWGPVIIIVVVIVLLIFIAAVVYKLRWYFRYWLFLWRLRRHRLRPSASTTSASLGSQDGTSGSTDGPKDDPYVYDAFVSYSNQDQAFVARLVAMLENDEPYFRLCVFERDFTAGTILNECILESIASSRKVILLLSDSFTRSQWCLWELHLAQHSLIEEKREGLILIKLGDLQAENVTPTLRYLMRTRIYLEWDENADMQKQRLFWTRLRNALIRPVKQFSIPRIV